MKINGNWDVDDVYRKFLTNKVSTECYCYIRVDIEYELKPIITNFENISIQCLFYQLKKDKIKNPVSHFIIKTKADTVNIKLDGEVVILYNHKQIGDFGIFNMVTDMYCIDNKYIDFSKVIHFKIDNKLEIYAINLNIIRYMDGMAGVTIN